MASVLTGLGSFAPGRVYATGQPSPRSITISDNRAGATGVTYDVNFTIATPGPLGSVEIEFCDNSPLIGDTCTAPAGFSATAAVLSSQSGQAGFSISSGSSASDIILTRPPTFAGVGNNNYVFTGIANPTAQAPLFARILTYASSDASGPANDAGGLALSIFGTVTISAEVPPYIIFCLGENIVGFDCTTADEAFSDMGSLTSTRASAAQHQVVVATNAQNGYSMWASGTTMTSGNNIINPMSAVAASVPGTSQFGMNLRANTNPVIGQDVQGAGVASVLNNYNQPNRFFFHSGDPIASSPTSDAYRKYTVSYIVNVPPGQPGGVYSTTLVYVCLANF